MLLMLSLIYHLLTSTKIKQGISVLYFDDVLKVNKFVHIVVWLFLMIFFVLKLSLVVGRLGNSVSVFAKSSFYRMIG